jgi:hypothetical protein
MDDPGLAGWTIQLLRNGQMILETTTAQDDPDTDMVDETGQYSFDGLFLGEYTVREVLQAGWERTFPTGDGTHVVTLDSENPMSTDNDFANLGGGSIHGRKFLDRDGDGRDGDDPGLAGWTIQLFQGRRPAITRWSRCCKRAGNERFPPAKARGR